MPNKNVRGGKHYKRVKRGGNMPPPKTELNMASDGQIYALVKKKVGGSRISVECSDSIERSAIIPGKFFRRIWINVGDILLCDLNRDGDDSVCYVNHKYTSKDANLLKLRGLISFEVTEEVEGIEFYDEVIAPQPIKNQTDEEKQNIDGHEDENVAIDDL